MTRRTLLTAGTAAVAAAATPVAGAPAGVTTGAARLAADQFRRFAGQRIGLVTNQTGRVGATHLADLLAKAPGVTLAAIFAPEHGFRGTAEAGAKVADDRDARTGVRVFSLYGSTRAPTAAMLAGIDVLVFDIQDIGARFYTYISTMGLVLQAAARARLPFVVLDRPNPLGGFDVAGFVLEPKHRSFVGQYPIPIVHGMTVGELARMIVAERWLAGVERAQLDVVAVAGWQRSQRWPATALPWVATSPNIPTFASALVYPGIGIVGETRVNEGRGTPIPFEQFGAPWLDHDATARTLDDARLPGAKFTAVSYVPRAVPQVAANPRFRDETVRGVRITVTDVERYRPLEVGMHALASLEAQARRRALSILPDGAMFTAIAGTTRLRSLIERGATGADLVASWQAEAADFARRRAPHLLYR